MGIVDDEPWLLGEPYYCALCGAGYGEYMACELPDCKLQTKAEAMDRRAEYLRKFTEC